MDNEVYVLDSTLRDGGYCNQWKFGYENKRNIILGLEDAGVDIIECGLLCKGKFTEEHSKYSDIRQFLESIPEGRRNSLFVLLMNYGEFDIDLLPENTAGDLDGIRFAFHKEDFKNAIEQMRGIKRKNYKVFMQPMVTVNYSTDEYMELINAANELEPYAFYVVDSFGSMTAEEVKKYSALADYLLKGSVVLGFHSHNNLQLAYSNAQLFIGETAGRKSIVDCCIMGMGRGAGNLNTELFLDHMNKKYGKRYKVEPILSVIDEIINVFYQKKYWGYSLPNYLSASYNMHPNYGSYLADKNTLTISMMGELLSLVDIGKKNTFDKGYMENLYVSYMCANELKNKARIEFSDIFAGRDILLIAPGKSIDTETEKIKKFSVGKNIMTISINFDFSLIHTDYVFLSNPKRYEEMGTDDGDRLIVTSNVRVRSSCRTADYLGLLCEEECIRDNATMMLIKLLINSRAKRLYLAGVDGYSIGVDDNYTKYSTMLVTSAEHMERMNQGMNKMIKHFGEEIDIQFVTSEKMIRR